MRISQEQLIKLHEIELDALTKFDEVCRKYDLNYTLAGGTLLGAVRHHGFIPWDDDVDVVLLRKDFEKLRKVDPKEWGEKYFYQSHQTDENYMYSYDKLRVNGTFFGEKALENTGIKHTGVFLDIFPADKVPEDYRQTTQILEYDLARLLFMSKYINIDYRKGFEKFIAKNLNLVLHNTSLKTLYNKIETIISKYNDVESTKYRTFDSFQSQKEVYYEKYLTELQEIPFEEKKFKISKYYDEILNELYGNYMALPPKDKQVNKHEVTDLIL